MRSTRRTTALLALAFAAPLALTGATATSAFAEPTSTPGGPYVQCGLQPIKLNGMHSNDELLATVHRLAEQRPDVVEVATAGYSVEGREIPVVTVGSGPRTLLVLTQQHGDEPIGTEAALQLLAKVSGNGPAAAALREEVTLVVVPRVNPDGWERYHADDLGSVIDPRRNSNNIDLNRTHGPANTTDLALAPESAAVHAVIDAVEPDVILDYHHQVTYAQPDGSMATMSLLWPTHPAVASDVVDEAKRATAVIAEAVDAHGHATVTKYPVSNTATMATNGFAMEGYPTVLVEQRGQQEVGQKSQGALTREALISMEATVAALADGSFDGVDPADADELPPRGERVAAACPLG
ncbi:zinc carboxypeptidase [Isoptericola variabilis J7]|uniref:Peptidase M14 carboxypeptidase A n=2 Tax=Isoptericola TaxID=254250 RepID=F6FQC4_ISOV2|nr:peptidase M14 carboxypeptidase A [Isoptericola variabilis 225]TWH34099.1 zinc carboxypeptidase [Isoptericola variabilis J7]